MFVCVYLVSVILSICVPEFCILSILSTFLLLMVTPCPFFKYHLCHWKRNNPTFRTKSHFSHSDTCIECLIWRLRLDVWNSCSKRIFKIYLRQSELVQSNSWKWTSPKPRAKNCITAPPMAGSHLLVPSLFPPRVCICRGLESVSGAWNHVHILWYGMWVSPAGYLPALQN